MMAEVGASGARSATPAPDPPASTPTSTSAAEDAATNAKGFLRLNLPSPSFSEGAPIAPEPAFITFVA
jgi:hypothetical protein